MNNKKCFTLAEALITVAILGVIAVMVVPNIVKYYQQQVFIVKAKKIYTVLDQINEMLKIQNNGNWTNLCNTYDNVCLMDLFSTELKVVKKCDRYPISNGCQSTSKYLNGANIYSSVNINYDFPSFITDKGYSVKFRFHDKGCNMSSCGWLQVDVNGLKGPNIAGKDIVFLSILKTDAGVPFLEPTGYGYSWDEIEQNCNSIGHQCLAYWLVKGK